MRRISSWIAGGSVAICFSSCASLITCASCSSTSATCSFWAGARTVLASDLVENEIDSAASRIAPANARPTERPNEEIDEFTPAASPTRSSEIGASV